ncbi:MAG: type IV secretory system conjugative DNA transfer family protein, partial [Planctomycetota bacterium]
MTTNAIKRRDTLNQKLDLLSDLPRGKDPRLVGVPPHSYFEPTANLLATESLRFNSNGNPESKAFLGILGGEIREAGRLPDGRINRYVVGGVPIGLLDDRHRILLAGSRAGKGRSVLIPGLITLPSTTSILCLDPKGDL